MIIVKFMGGMGNQLFQYAAGRAVALKNGAELKIDITGYENQDAIITPREYSLQPFNIQENFASQEEIEKIKGSLSGRMNLILQKIGFSKKNSYFVEPKFSFNPEMLEIGKNAYLQGYWQSEKYFKNIREIICKEFALKNEYNIEEKEITKEIKSCKAVSLHIRRGDYVSSATTSKFHGICSLEYYAKAVAHMIGNLDDLKFFIFSDDIEWVKENLKIDAPKTFVSDGKLKDYEELILMSYCRHNIIANSSFSWWGAWLNNNPEKIVIGPKNWFVDKSVDTSDVIPETWIKL